ncbi:hypothetical protein [Streptomyces somaliensis]|uniref:Integral membrane protein n=1 Tax=Streptomyces somaliensis (strain ATCC 33201 / DSM 40738 / JCM 12659 / KCTC 9044 / NCTC 11332 / NRRL B-12077 / IP 733) TaxID=1134445 RepID=A0AA44DG03_STRE0|nr:hypothetical protein [Streptomyces somaliensis]NKY15552.1 hypothetical protein [Streptomyces somaliensis DSM 40738]
MYGPGPGPVPPQRRTPIHVVVLRVLFAVLPLLSLGFLTGAATLRLALVTRRPRDWWLFGLSVLLTVTCMVLTADDTDSGRSSLGVAGLLLNAALFTGYFLYADIRHHDLPASAAAPSPYATTFPAAGCYGYPPQGATYPGAPPAAVPPYGRPQPPAVPGTPVPPRLPAQPPAAPRAEESAAPRIDRVRAELDELSDLLRREDGGR